MCRKHKVKPSDGSPRANHLLHTFPTETMATENKCWIEELHTRWKVCDFGILWFWSYLASRRTEDHWQHSRRDTQPELWRTSFLICDNDSETAWHSRTGTRLTLVCCQIQSAQRRRSSYEERKPWWPIDENTGQIDQLSLQITQSLPPRLLDYQLFHLT